MNKQKLIKLPIKLATFQFVNESPQIILVIRVSSRKDVYNFQSRLATKFFSSSARFCCAFRHRKQFPIQIVERAEKNAILSFFFYISLFYSQLQVSSARLQLTVLWMKILNGVRGVFSDLWVMRVCKVDGHLATLKFAEERKYYFIESATNNVGTSWGIVPRAFLRVIVSCVIKALKSEAKTVISPNNH